MTIRHSRFSLSRRFIRSDERGIALPMVLMVFLVGFALVAAFLVAIVGSANVSTSTRSNVQAQAAAEAGIAAQIAKIGTGNPCTVPGAETAVGAVPQYKVTVVTTNCTAASNATVTFESLGTAPGSSTAKVQAVFPVSPGVLTPIKAAGFYISVQAGNLNGLTLQSTLNPVPPTIIAQGDYVCGGGGVTIPGDLYVMAGNARFNTGCKIGGTVYVRGDVQDTAGGGNEFKGDIRATGNVTIFRTLNPGGTPRDIYAGGTITLANQNMTQGNLYASGAISFKGPASSYTITGAIVSGSSITGGPTNVTRTQNSTSVPPPSVPAVSEIPKWVDFPFNASDWVGYTLETWDATKCNTLSNSNKTPWLDLAEKTTPTLVDATACTHVQVSGGLEDSDAFALEANVAIIAKKITFHWSGTTIRGAGATRTLSVVIPDATADGVATCTGGGSVNFNGVTVETSAHLNIYSPCPLNAGSSTLRGGLFIGGLGSVTSSTFVLSNVTLPNANFGIGLGNGGTSGGGGAGSPTLTGGTSAKPTTQRNIN